MSITQYSKIQHRRGTFTEFNLMPGPLNTSELGHIIDEQRLFIGNGQTSEGAPVVGNTEIITDVTLLNNPYGLKYTYQSNTGVLPQTGSTPNTPTIRSIGQILDDYVSVKSFGAAGDGQTDDTDAINRALKQLFTLPIPSNAPAGYRVLYFPAGVYITSGYCFLPPNCVIDADGSGSTIIKQTNSSANSVFKTADSLFQNGAQMGAGGAILPTNIKVKNLTLQHQYDQTVLRLERASNVLFEGVTFLGAWTGAASNTCGVYLDSLGQSSIESNIRFSYCSFLYTYYAINISANAPYANLVYLDNCLLSNLNNGIFTSFICQDIKVSNSNFSNIIGSALIGNSMSSNVSSSNNTYNTCGSSNAPVIWFMPNAISCSSVNDQFINCGGTPIQNDGQNSLVISNYAPLTVQNITVNSVLPPITLLGQASSAPAPTGFSSGNNVAGIDMTKFNTGFIDYTLIRGTTVRVGRILFVCKESDPSQTAFSDLFTENNPSGIVFDYSIAGTVLSIVYTDTQANASSSSIWNTQPKFWFS